MCEEQKSVKHLMLRMTAQVATDSGQQQQDSNIFCSNSRKNIQRCLDATSAFAELCATSSLLLLLLLLPSIVFVLMRHNCAHALCGEYCCNSCCFNCCHFSSGISRRSLMLLLLLLLRCCRRCSVALSQRSRLRPHPIIATVVIVVAIDAVIMLQMLLAAAVAAAYNLEQAINVQSGDCMLL